jgi:hypothetical protein
MRVYSYVGPAGLAAEANSSIERFRPASRLDLVQWASGRRRIEATFVVDEAGYLWLSDRRTEHVACARGRAVLAAGELVLERDDSVVEIRSVTNQSTGYCPEPSSWEAFAAALRRLGITPPRGFSDCFEFRRCRSCGTINVLKETDPDCACGAELPALWNCDERPA